MPASDVSLLLHADWSVDARKRWMTIGTRVGGSHAGAWRFNAAVPVGDLATWMPRLRDLAGGGGVALGVDLPLGLPRAYVCRHLTEPDFPTFLRSLANHPEFFKVCASLSEIGPRRPFYPARGQAGMTRAAHAAALGLDGPAGLSRACDRATAERPAGAPLFWTLGANQTGKAAITAWRDCLLPARLLPNAPRLWPFEGGFLDLLRPGAIVVAETYPAQALRQLGLRMNGSKRRQSDRATLAEALLGSMAQLGAEPEHALTEAICHGFGADPTGEDQFDSLIGALAVLGVVTGRHPDFIPDNPWIRRWEGWVLGQTKLPAV